LALWVQCALLVGALAVGLCLGWIGGSVSSRFFAAAPAPVQQADASACAREGTCAAAKADREAAKIAGPRARIAARGAQQASANRDVATTSSIAAPERGKIAPRLMPIPETRPTTIEGWAIREVTGSTVVLQGPGGAGRENQEASGPGVGGMGCIGGWGRRWIVGSTRGLISTADCSATAGIPCATRARLISFHESRRMGWAQRNPSRSRVAVGSMDFSAQKLAQPILQSWYPF